MDAHECLLSRRSVRRYTEAPVDRTDLIAIIHAGTRAPSGLNNQPWRFVLITDRAVRERLACLTTSAHIIRNAPSCIAVFIDTLSMYHPVKDHQAVGACIQNMLLAAHARGLGAVWLGEILKNADAVRELLAQPGTIELMAVVAVGHPASHEPLSPRKDLDEVLLKEF